LLNYLPFYFPVVHLSLVLKIVAWDFFGNWMLAAVFSDVSVSFGLFMGLC